MDWAQGYVTEINYTRGYYRELNPLLQSFVLATTGRHPPSLRQPFTKVELGCGYGVSLLLEAAAHPHAQFYGIDINPNHISWAKHLAAEAQLDNVHFLEIGFADLLESSILELEFIGMHGVWSWVSQSNRDLIVDFLKRRLKSGGVAMISYNVLPGWSAHQGLRELLMRKFNATSG